jgi:hypothetical protein
MALRDTALGDTALCGMALCDTALCGMALCDTALCGTALCDTALCDTALGQVARLTPAALAVRARREVSRPPTTKRPVARVLHGGACAPKWWNKTHLTFVMRRRRHSRPAAFRLQD